MQGSSSSSFSSFGAPLSKRLEGKVALITGWASGIGEATVRLFLRHGAKVMIADIDDFYGHLLSENLDSDNMCYVHCDVAIEKDVENSVNTAVSRYDKLDIMFSNASIFGNCHSFNSTMVMDSTDLKKVFEVTVLGAFYAAKHATKAMIPQKKGSIVLTFSIPSVIDGAGTHMYGATKEVLVGLMKNLCVELGNHGIRVNYVSPYGVATRVSLGPRPKRRRPRAHSWKGPKK